MAFENDNILYSTIGKKSRNMVMSSIFRKFP